jgi:hypothetical protein
MKLISKIIFIAFLFFTEIELHAKKIEFFGFYPLWGEQYERPSSISKIHRFFLDTLQSDVNRNGQKVVLNSDLNALIEKLESKKKSYKEIECVVGFYFKDNYDNLILDIFVFDGKDFAIIRSKRVILDDHNNSSDFAQIASALYNSENIEFKDNSVKGYLFLYILPYQARYFSERPFNPGIDSTKLAKVKLLKPMKINGKISSKDIFNEIEKAFNSNAQYTVFRKQGFGILDIYDKVTYGKAKKFRKYQEMYRDFFSKHPILLRYVKVASTYHLYATTSNKSSQKDNYRRDFQDAVTEFLHFTEKGDFKEIEVSFFRSYGLNINQVRTDVVIRSDKIFKCSQNEKLAIESENIGNINQAIYYYYNLIKFCGEKDSYTKFLALSDKKDSLYFEYVTKAHKLEDENAHPEAIELYLKAQVLKPYVLFP